MAGKTLVLKSQKNILLSMIAGIISERNALLKSVMNIYTAGNKKERIRRMTSLLFLSYTYSDILDRHGGNILNGYYAFLQREL